MFPSNRIGRGLVCMLWDGVGDEEYDRKEYDRNEYLWVFFLFWGEGGKER